MLIELFLNYGLGATVTNSKSMTCQLETLQSGMSGGVGGTAVQRKRSDLLRASEKKDPLTVLQSGTYREFNDGTHTAYKWDKFGN